LSGLGSKGFWLVFIIWVLAASLLVGTGDAKISLANYSAAREAIDSKTPNGLSHLTTLREPPVQILPLGDSITQGNGAHMSYRYSLWTELIDAEIDFDFVGSLSSNSNGNPTWPEYEGYVFDRDHEGHAGWRAEQILEGLPGWLEGYTPAIVLLHIGTNDVLVNQSTESTVKEIKQIINVLQDDNSTVTVFLAQIIPTENPASNRRIDELNKQIDEIAEAESTEESLVVVVDQNSKFDVDEDTYDGVHPNEAGEEKMAQKWFDAIDELLENHS
jgi:lysophospholipase L1-like esterase